VACKETFAQFRPRCIRNHLHNLALIASVAGLVESGPGAPSVDRALSIERSGAAWALASLAAGAAGSALAIEAGRRVEQPADDPL
jgi:hypothetical protein